MDPDATVSVGRNPIDAARSPLAARVADILRDIARGGLAGLAAGVVVGGIGGRIVMRLATLLSPDAAGLLTDNGNRVGTISFDGSMAVVLFLGVGAGLVGGVVWVAVSSWIPGRGVVRATLSAGLAVALGGLFLVDRENNDFVVLSNDGAIVVLLLGLLGLLGATVSWLDERLQRRLPAVAGHDGAVVAFGLVTLVGLVLVPGAISFYFGTTGCGCSAPPVSTGGALLVSGLATLTCWAVRIATGRSTVPRLVAWTGRAALVAAAVTGSIRVGSEVLAILG